MITPSRLWHLTSENFHLSNIFCGFHHRQRLTKDVTRRSDYNQLSISMIVAHHSLLTCMIITLCIPLIWNRMRPRALLQDQHERDLLDWRYSSTCTCVTYFGRQLTPLCWFCVLQDYDLLSIKVMYDYMMQDRLLWETTDRDVIIIALSGGR